ncbi:hypothetical protein SteCoe_29424 [Stentor coeruleus]|uniref:EF-hand domain-containing protein n=1 Tax=Stentor coeruleus TaxID=5963 RepID=A0A1R2B6D2_9CILI|nr:hypothetical protein SteCoe_29424 [Stentor coeruleus]
MGNRQIQEAPKLRRSELEEFSKQSLLLPTVIERLYVHFYRISRSKTEDGVIDLSEFCLTIKKSETSVISERIFHMFDSNSDGVINFREFITGISAFSDNQDLLVKENIRMATIRMKEKIDLSMRIFDLKNANKIYERDLIKILSSLMQERNFLKLSKKQIKKVVKNTLSLEKAQEDENGKYWDQQSYSQMVMKTPQIFKWLSVDLENIKRENKIHRNAHKCFSV